MNGVLFKWNNNVDKYPEGIIEPGMVLDRVQPIPLIKDKI